MVLAKTRRIPAGLIVVSILLLVQGNMDPGYFAQTPGVAKPIMVNIASRAGVTFKQINYATPMKYPFETLGGAVAAFDFNNDGAIDLLFLNGSPSPQHLKTDPESFNRLYRNNGDGTFTDVTESSGLSGRGMRGYPQGVAIGDYDNDGFADVLITQYGDNILYHNNGNGTFTDVTTKAGVSMNRNPFKASACWVDIDNDGYLDLFVTGYFQWTFQDNSNDYCGERKPGYRTYCTPDVFKPLPNALFRNNGDGTFTDISQKSGIDKHPGKGMGVTIADYNGDGKMDIFVTNDKMPNFLYRNEGGGVFKEVAMEAGVFANESGSMVSGMGCDFKDYNNDGWPDVFYADLIKESFTLFSNGGKGFFSDMTFPSGVGILSAAHSAWSNKFMDFDKDGWKDIFIAGSHVVDNVELYNSAAHYKEPCFIYRNLGTGKFEDISKDLGSDFQVVGGNRGVAVADFDNDGDLEVAVNRLNDTPLLFKKKGGDPNHWLILNLQGTRSNRDGIGAKIKLTLPSGRKLYDHVTTANGIYSASDKRVHFGLGKETKASLIEIEWPSGIRQTLENVPADQILPIKENGS
ncbi:MAG TPA: CRTAC1 family protein [Terriglobia bacterium]|nr:CRTAC1 family protein [Terriglobia bacterium]